MNEKTDFFPSFDENGNINMQNIMSAKPMDFAQYGVDVPAHLSLIRSAMLCFDKNKDMWGQRSNLAHDFLDKHDTPEAKSRKAGYQLSPIYCFYYNIYVMLTNLTCHHMSDSEIYDRDLAVLDCEITIAQNPSIVIGRNNERAKTYNLKTVTVPKGCPYVCGNKTFVSKRKHDVFVQGIYEGYYDYKVFHPRIVWSGKGKYWNEANLKDVLQQKYP